MKEAETNLAKLGFFSELPDWFNTQSTSGAVRRFQELYRLKATGIIDRETMLRLREAVLRSSC